MVLFGTEYWRQVIDFDALVRHGTIDARDVELVHRTDSIDDAYDCSSCSSPSTRSGSRARRSRPASPP